MLQDRPEEALKFAHQAIQFNHESFTNDQNYTQTPTEGYFRYDYYFESVLLKATAFQALDSDQEALHQYKIADQVLDGAKYQINSRKDKVNLADAVYRLSKNAIDHTTARALEKHQPEYLQEAFYFSEKSKANVLLQAITGNRAKSFGDIPDSLIAKEEALQADINYYSVAVASQPDSAQIPIFREALFEAQQDHIALIQQFETAYPAYYELKYQHSIPGIASIQDILPSGQAVISYFTADTILYVFYLDRDRFQVQQSAVGSDFIKNARQFRDGIALQLPEEYFSRAYELYSLLFPFTILQLLDHSEYAHPYYWSAFLLMGK